MNNSFGSICREWRKQRRYSQLKLAVELEVSSKHISFIETGRSMPSREMVIKIGMFLAIPKKEINRGLYAAGYTPAFTQLSYEHEDLKQVMSAIEHMLHSHMPYPAVVLNQNWDMIKANQSAFQLLEKLGFAGSQNLVEAMILDSSGRSNILNWHESAHAVLDRLKHDISMQCGNKKLEALKDELASCLANDDGNYTLDTSKPTNTVHLQVSDNRLSFFSIIAQLGTIQDVTVSELRVELMFPADENTINYVTTQRK